MNAHRVWIIAKLELLLLCLDAHFLDFGQLMYDAWLG